MHTFGDLKSDVRAYLQAEAPSAVDSTLELGGSQSSKDMLIDGLILRAANNARIKAEKRHDFDWANDTVEGSVPSDGNGVHFKEFYRLPHLEASLFVNAGLGTLTFESVHPFGPSYVKASDTLFYVAAQDESFTDTVTPGNAGNLKLDWPGFALSDVGSVANGTYDVFARSYTGLQSPGTYKRYCKVKTVHNAWVVDSDGNDIPIHFEKKMRTSARLLEHQDRRLSSGCPWDFSVLMQIGERLFLYPSNTSEAQVIRLDANLWMEDYVGDNDTDQFFEHGYDYLQWATIVEVNRLLRIFVPRQEGNLPPPIRERDEALKELIDFDVWQSQTGTLNDLD